MPLTTLPLARFAALALLPLVLVCCDKKDGDAPTAPADTAKGATTAPGAKTGTAATATTSAPAATTAAATAAPTAAGGKGMPDYAQDGFKKVPAGCKTPTAVLATTPMKAADQNPYDKKKEGFAFHFARQALLAHPEFKIVPQKDGFDEANPPGPMAVKMGYVAGSPPDHVVLVAHCSDADTCNKLMAMYKRVVPSSKPEGTCGNPPQTAVYGKASTGFQAQGPQSDMPVDVQGRCTRLAACMIRADTSTPGDPGLECQKAPAKFKVDCANKATCNEVVACTKG